jgi:hypothetical protein
MHLPEGQKLELHLALGRRNPLDRVAHVAA